MRHARAILFVAMFAGLSGCSSEDLKRTGFESLQNVRERDCPQGVSGCPDRESYERYREEKKRLESPDS
jgi:O-acetyl-ADP-ribose deacetylase (regulator of RNase III)